MSWFLDQSSFFGLMGIRRGEMVGLLSAAREERVRWDVLVLSARMAMSPSRLEVQGVGTLVRRRTECYYDSLISEK